MSHGAIPFGTSDGLAGSLSMLNNPQSGSAPSIVERLAPQSSEPISAVLAPVPPAHNMAQHQEVLCIFEVYALDTCHN